jgi:hypothetical protein
LSKRHLTPALLVAALAAIAVAGVASGSSSPQIKTARTIHVVEHPINETVTDLKPSGDSPGDLLTFANPVFDRTNDDRVGRDQGSCIRITRGNSWQCSWTAFLHGGSITVEGPFFDTRDSQLAITGGTGAFRNVRGQMNLHTRSDGNFDFVYHVQP